MLASKVFIFCTVELLSDQLLALAVHRDSRCRKTRVCEFVCVAVTYFDFDPIVFDRLVYPSLKISISHFAKVIASECATRANFVSQKNAKDLAPNFFIRWHLAHLLSFAHPTHSPFEWYLATLPPRDLATHGA